MNKLDSKKMKTKFIMTTFVVAVAMISAINVFNANKTETLSDIALANVEALASDSEGGPNWRGYTLDSKNSCCIFIGIPDVDCSGNYKQCK